MAFKRKRSDIEIISELLLKLHGELHVIGVSSKRLVRALEAPPESEVVGFFVTIGVEAKEPSSPCPTPKTCHQKRSDCTMEFEHQVVKPDGSAFTTTEQAKVTVKFVKNGRPMNVDPNNPPRFEIQGEAMGAEVRSVEFTGNAVSAKFRPADTAGQTIILMTADPKMGDGQTPFSILFPFAWIDDEADNAEVSFEVEPKEA